MRAYIQFMLFTVLLLVSKVTAAQNLSTGIPEIDLQLKNAGLSLLENATLKIDARAEKNMTVTCYGGNLYYIGTAHNGAANHRLSIEIKNEKGDLYFTGTQGIELDLRYLHGKFPLTLNIKNPNDVTIPEFLLVKAYRSSGNASSDDSANLSEKAYYTLEGVTLIKEEKEKIIKEIELYLTKELTRQGYSVSATKALIHDGKSKVSPYTFYRENDYVIFGLGANGTPASFQVLDPASKRENPFGGEPIEREERIIQESAEGVVGVSFRDKNPNLWSWAIRPDYNSQNFGSLSVFVVGYHSSGNTSGQVSDNKPEKFYVR